MLYVYECNSVKPMLKYYLAHSGRMHNHWSGYEVPWIGYSYTLNGVPVNKVINH